MSATAFQRMRREATRVKPVADPVDQGEFAEITKKEIMKLLTEKGIEYNEKMNKTQLTDLLQGTSE